MGAGLIRKAAQEVIERRAPVAPSSEVTSAPQAPRGQEVVGASARGLKPVAFTLSAGVAKQFGIAGSWFHVVSAPVADLYVRFDGGEAVPAPQGLGMEHEYSSFELESATGQAVVVLVGYGRVEDGRSTATVNVTANVAPGNTFDDGGDVAVPDSAATLIRAADSDTLYVTVTNPSGSAGPVRVGTAGVDISKGQLIEPGVSAPIACTAALYAYHENGSDVTLSVAAVQQV